MRSVVMKVRSMRDWWIIYHGDIKIGTLRKKDGFYELEQPSGRPQLQIPGRFFTIREVREAVDTAMTMEVAA